MSGAAVNPFGRALHPPEKKRFSNLPMITRTYRLVNNVGGWLVFAVALITYWCTLEPTASYWDCGEFIIQADKLEVGHPPGNPIFMLTARFFSNFATDAGSISVMVNAMSGLLSALTILLLFWTITHLVRRLVVRDSQQSEISIQQYIAIMGSGLVGSLAYCWSDTFWFSAVEGEVYAFSSFCTALVFWLILKWEDHADSPHSDRYLILIAYIIGVSIAVHLLNLLCIPAIVLVFAYRKYKEMNLVKSLVALVVGFFLVALVLFGLVPGFIKVAQQFELLFVNGFRLGFNSGAVCYALVAAGIFIWTLSELYRQRNPIWIRVSLILTLAVSGIFFFGDTFIIGWFLLAFVAFLLFSKYGRNLSVRFLTVAVWSIAVIFVGYSSYALILIRASAHTPMNQNAPDNVFDLAAYLNREQYGENPLIYGETLYSSPQRQLERIYRDTIGYMPDGTPAILSTPVYTPVINPGRAIYAKGVEGATPVSEYDFLSPSEIESNNSLAQRGGDYYVKRDYKPESKMNPELNMLFPRIYSRQHQSYYSTWVTLDTAPGQLVAIHARGTDGSQVPEYNTQAYPQENNGFYSYPQKYAFKPSFGQNLRYFFNYQLNHMYMRYFMWNFAGRQNDINNQMGELDAGNWISGIPFIDNARLGDQNLLPYDLGKGNPGHNVYYMLPLVLGLIGLIWQSFAGRRGIEQFWVVFFLFFMTGIAIVLYLNQPPNQPRERDYAFAGSFYAYAIWIGMGVAALWRIFMLSSGTAALKRFQTVKMPDGGFPTDTPEGAELQEKLDEQEEIDPQIFKGEPVQLDSIVNEPKRLNMMSTYFAALALLVGILVPIQMVSQTWDDHDRSGRFAARDFAINYLESLEPNAIVFCNGDNDTFPLWYVQEVEGVRPDVRIINLSYLNSDWYANQMLRQAYDSAPVKLTATPATYAYGKADVTLLGQEKAPADLLSSLKIVYEQANTPNRYSYPTMPSAVVTIPIDKEAVVKAGLVAPKDISKIVDKIVINLANTTSYRQKNYLSLGEILMLDIIATNAAEGWPRPIYWASTVGDDYHLGLSDYMMSTGMAQQILPTFQEGIPARTDRAYDVVTKKYRWGGADFTEGKAPYFDETARRMLLTTRSSMLEVVSELLYEGDLSTSPEERRADYEKALEVANLMSEKLDERTAPYGISIATTLAQAYCELGESNRLDNKEVTQKGLDLLKRLMEQYAPYLQYNRAMALSFSNPTLTYETRLIPYQYYRFITLYESFGGSPEVPEEILKPYGFTVKELEDNYNRAYRPDVYREQMLEDGQEVDLGVSKEQLEEYAAEIASYCEVANRMAKLTPQEYAEAPEEDKVVDSIIYQAVEYYRQIGGDMELLKSYSAFDHLDMTRAKRLYEDFSARDQY